MFTDLVELILQTYETNLLNFNSEMREVKCLTELVGSSLAPYSLTANWSAG